MSPSSQPLGEPRDMDSPASEARASVGQFRRYGLRPVLVAFLCMLPVVVVRAQAPTIATYAGGGVPTAGPATATGISTPGGIGIDPAGNLYFTSGTGTISKVTPAGALSVFAGTGPCCYSGDGGPATKAQISILPSVPISPLKTDPSGNVYVVDNIGVIRRIDHSTGIITTVAGTPNPTGKFGGAGGPATSAFMSPAGLVFDAAGDLFISDYNNVVWRVDHATQVITIVAGVAGPGCGPKGDGGSATSAQLCFPAGLAVDSAGDLFIAEAGDVRRVDGATQIITTYAGGGSTSPPTGVLATDARLGDPSGLAFDPAGNLVIGDGGLPAVLRVDKSTQMITIVAGDLTLGPGFSGDGGPATSAQLGNNSTEDMDVVTDASGDIFVADTVNYRVRRIAVATQIITTIAGNGGVGDGGPATQALLFSSGLAHDNSGNVFIGDVIDRRVRRVDAATGLISTVAGKDAGTSGGFGGPATAAQLNTPAGIALDGSGNLFITDRGNDTLDEVSGATGIITLFAGTPGSRGFGGDGGPATSAKLDLPRAVASDTQGNLYIADQFNNVIRKVVRSTGIITTVAGNTSILSNGTPVGGYSGDGGPATSAQLLHPSGGTIDSKGDGFIADGGNNVIRRVDAGTGIITTIAGNHALGPGFSGDGGPALLAQLNAPASMALDAFGNLYITDSQNYRVRMVNAVTGIITTLAGNGNFTFGGDGGPASDASLFPYQPGLTVLGPDGDGNLRVLVMDGTSGRTRVITIPPVSATFLSPMVLTYGNLAVGTTSAPQLVTIANSGTGTLDVSNVAVTGADAQDFALGPGGTCVGESFALAPTASCTIAVRFKPTSNSEQNAAVTITDNSNGSPHVVTLEGDVRASMNVVPDSLTFLGQVPGTTSSPTTVTVTNVGDASLLITKIAATAGFAETDNCIQGTGIAPGDSCTLSVTFMPPGAGVTKGTLVITSNAVGSPRAVSLQGSSASFPASQTITQPLSPTEPNQFNFATHTFGVQYPPGTNFSGVNMSVTATQTSEDGYAQRVAGTPFANSTCIQYTGGTCVDYAVSCTDMNGNTIVCPSESTPSINVKASYDTLQPITNPGFLTAPTGTNNWTNIFTAFYEQRIDPTTRGRTHGFSEFFAVDLGTSNTQGAGTLEFEDPLQQSDDRQFPVGTTIPVKFQLASIANPGTFVTDAVAGIAVVMVADEHGNPVTNIVLENSTAFTFSGGSYGYSLNTTGYAPGTYNVTVYGNAFAAQQIQFTLPAPTTSAHLVTTLQSFTLDTSQNQYVVVLGFANPGTTIANGLLVTSAQLNSTASTTTLPLSVGDLGSGATATATLAFPASAGAPATGGILNIKLSYAGGTAGAGFRVVLP